MGLNDNLSLLNFGNAGLSGFSNIAVNIDVSRSSDLMSSPALIDFDFVLCSDIGCTGLRTVDLDPPDDSSSFASISFGLLK